MTAAASGTLALRGRCLVLEGGGETTQLAFATADTRWDASARALRVGSRSFALGSRVEIGGGEFAGNGDTLPWVRRPAADCGGRFWIVSSLGAATGAEPRLPLYRDRPGAGSPDAMVSGVLVREGACLYIDRPAVDGGRIIPVFPSGTARWDVASQTLRFGTSELRVGSPVAFAGGERRRSGGVADLAPAPAPECRGETLWIVAPHEVQG